MFSNELCQRTDGVVTEHLIDQRQRENLFTGQKHGRSSWHIEIQDTHTTAQSSVLKAYQHAVTNGGVSYAPTGWIQPCDVFIGRESS
jgi:hypothetical protein